MNRIKGNIIRYFAPKIEYRKEDTAYLSAEGDSLLNSTPDYSDDEDDEMAKLQMKGLLSLKDATDLIPRYNGENITLARFPDGCEEAKGIVLADYDTELAKLIRMRLSGDALNTAWKVKFESMKEVAEFFEKTFGSAKIYFDLTGGLANVRQKPNESVVFMPTA